MQIKAWLDNSEIVEVLKTLSNEVEKLKAKVTELEAHKWAMKGQDD